jgi:hypothetical protein
MIGSPAGPDMTPPPAGVADAMLAVTASRMSTPANQRMVFFMIASSPDV